MSNANDLATLVPAEAELVIGGVKIKVLPLGFFAGIKYQAELVPVINALLELASEEADIPIDKIGAIFNGHQPLLFELMAVSTSKPVEWVESLEDEDGLMLLMTFWKVNSGFFVRRLVIAATARRREHQSAGEKSVPP
jgi:hypothetical protein